MSINFKVNKISQSVNLKIHNFFNIIKIKFTIKTVAIINNTQLLIQSRKNLKLFII
jgi:hypothetical protein